MTTLNRNRNVLTTYPYPLMSTAPQVSVIAIANGNEADGTPAVFRFSRTGSTTDPLSVSYRLLGTAQAGSDYSGATTGTINFSAGSATAELSLPALADSVIDPGETIIAQIVPSPSAPASYVITPGQQTATATITAEGMVVTANGPSRPGGSKGEYRNTGAFAAIRGDGSVVTWGDPDMGGDSSGVALQFGYGITQIFSTESAFAAINSDGSVVTWGSSVYGGDSSGVAGKLSSGVAQIFASRYAFAALKGDGSVVSWGQTWSGGNSNGVAGQLSSGVTQIFSTDFAFAALKSDGSVVTWDSITFGGDSSGVAGQLSSDVTHIFSNQGAFAALKSDGSVVTWGYGPWGGDSSGVASRLSSGITKIYSTVYAFAALKGDGSVVTWGDSTFGSDSSGVAGQLSSGVTQIFSNEYAFAALKADGSVVTWGQGSYGGDSSVVAAKLSSGVTQIFSTNNAFAALKGDGSVVTWGLDPWGGNSNGVADQLSSGVTQIFSTTTAFAALKGDGSVVTWGDSTGGANSNGVADQLSSGVTQIFSNGSAFVALKADGSVITWGNASYGGDSSGVAGQLNNIVAFANPLSDDRLEVFADLLPSITLLAGTPAVVREDGTTNLLFTFIRTGRTDSELTVNYTVGGTASLGTDYTGIAELPATKAIAFAAGSATATVVIDPIADTEIESDETVSLTLAAGTGYTIATSTAVASTIVNDDLRSGGSVISAPIPVSNPGRTGGEVRNRDAFAVIRSDGSVVTWGDASFGGDSSGVADQLSSGVSQIFSTYYGAFAALKGDGSVVTWGAASYGGDSSGVAGQISSGVTQIFSNDWAFAALKGDGSVVTWGVYGGEIDSRAVAGQLSSGVTQIFSTDWAFAALKGDGSVVTWGLGVFGGNSSDVAGQLSSGVTQIFSNDWAFAALKADGSVVTWGSDGGDSSGVASQLSSGVTQIFSTQNAFAALKADGSVVTWGSDGGDSSGVAGQLSSGVTQIFSTDWAFAALKADGSVVTWGATWSGGDSLGVTGQLSSDVTQIFSTAYAFAALKGDGSVVTWGGSGGTGDSRAVADQLSSGVTQIFSNDWAFAALKGDGSIVTWGHTSFGGDSSGVAGLLTSGVTQIFSTEWAFAALKADGSVVTWGYPDRGGDSTAVAAWLTNVVAFANPFTDDRLVFDALPSISLAVSPASAGEDGTADLIYTFTRTGATTSELTVNYIVGGTASLGTDYTGIAELPATKEITFAAGSATATVVIDPIADDEIEADETVSFTLAAGTGYTIGTTEAVIATINDLLLAPTIDAITGDDNLSVSEYEDGITITGSGNAGATVTIQFEDAFFSSSGDHIPPAHNVAVNSDGQWSLNLSPAQVGLLGVGDDMVVAYQSWPGSDGVSETSYRLFTIESAPAPTIDVIGGDDVITTAEAIAGFTIHGTGVPGASILLAFSSGFGVEAGAIAIVDTAGIWSLSISPQDVVGFADGVETIEVSQQLLGTGFTSGLTSRSFVIEAAPLPTVDAIATDNIISPEEAQLGFAISGSGLPGATIILLFASGVTPEVGSSVEVNQAGRWSFFVSPADIARIGPISESIEVYQVITQLGLTSSVVPHDFLIEDAPVPSIDAITGDDSISASDLRSGFVISGRGMPGSTIHLEFNSGTLLQSGSTALVAADGTWSVSVVQTDVIGFDLGQEAILVRQTIPVVGFTSGAVSNTFTVEVINLPPSSVDLNNVVTSLAENSSTLAVIKVADIAISDDVLGSNVISLEGADAAFFEVVGTGLFLKAGTSLDYEAKASYSLTVSVSDPSVAGSVPVTASYWLSITDVNEAPTAVVLNNSSTSLEENTATLVAIKVADIAISDDAPGSNSISLAGADAAFFEVMDSGLFLKAGTSLDYETKSSYAVTVSVSDPSVAASVPVTTSYALAITDVNEAPTAVVLNNRLTSLEENTPTLTAIKVGDIAISDDALGSNTISLAGADAAFFEVVGTGLFLKAGTSLNYEAKASFSLTVSVSDPTVAGSIPVTTSYALAITDVNEAPTAVVLNNRLTSLEENTPTLTAIKVGDIAISDDALGSNTISLAGADAASFEVVGNGLFLKAGTSLNYEAKASYSLTVSVSDPSVAGSVPVTTSYGLAVRDLNEAPTALNLSATAFDENIPAGSQIAMLSTADPDSSPQSFTYSLVSGTGSTHNLFFSILGNALRITRSPDYETRSSYSIRLRTTDQGGLFNERSVVLNVNDLPDSPTYSFSKSADVVYERGALAIGVSTTNVAAGKLLYWSLSGTNITAGDFSDGTLLGSVSLGDDGKASFTKVVAADGVIEADESLNVKFFNDAARSQQIGSTLSVTLKDPVVGVVSDGPDIITGTGANEVISGVPTGSSLRGRGTVDRLTGGGGNDQFLLADRTGAYYNDGDPATDGSADIAVITDFNAGDSIRLFGSASLYQLSQGVYGGSAGLWIRILPTGSGVSERIGFVQSATLSSLSLSNATQFTYLN